MWTLFAFAFLARVGVMWACATPREVGSLDDWTFGYEAAAIGRSLSQGLGFANPWLRPEVPWNEASGATGWLPPVYPALLGWLMGLTGGVTPALAAVLFTLQSAFSAATCVLLARLGSAVGEARAGRAAAWVFALYPVSIWNAVHTVWDTTLAAFGLTAFLWVLFRWGRDASLARAIQLGALFGLVLWINPAPIAIAPVAAIVLARGSGSFARGLARVALFGCAALAVCSPWMLRNARAVGAYSLRTNLGVELAVGNNDRANGHYQPALHPSFDPAEFMAYRELGEVAYSRARFDTARKWIAAHPAAFVRLSLKRLRIFWLGETPWADPRRAGATGALGDPKSWIKWLQHALFGLLSIAGAIAFARRRFEGRILLGVLLLFPAAYYATHFMERYRFPIEPLVVFLATWAVLAWFDAARARNLAVPVE